MKVAVFGSGGIGSYYGAGFARGGARVSLIARGAHLDAIRRDGLTIETPEGSEHHRLDATDDTAQIGPVDIVLFCVKSYDTASAAASLPPLLGSDTAVVSLQNGIDNEAAIADVIGWQHVLGSAAYIFAEIRAPGIVVASGPRSIVFGEWQGDPDSPRVRRIVEAAEAASRRS